MIQRDYLIIGSGIGGGSACESIRKYDKRGQITLVGAETFAPYKRWMLSKTFLRDKVAPMKKMLVLDAHWYDKHKIETRFATMVTQVNIDRRLAVLGNGETIEFNKACLAMGSRPVRPPVAGVGLGNVIYLRTIRDALALREMASLEKAIVVVGGGLLACEAASSLRQMKFKVSMMHRNGYLLNRYLDPETGAWATSYFEKHEWVRRQDGIAQYPDEKRESDRGWGGGRGMRSGTESGAGPEHSACRPAWLAGERILGDRGKRNLRDRRSGVLSGSDHGRRASSDALGKCPGTRARRGGEHDRQETNSL